MGAIAPLMEKLGSLKRLHMATHSGDPRFVIVNQFTAQQLTNEAQAANNIKQEGNALIVDELAVVVHAQDNTRNIVMEVV